MVLLFAYSADICVNKFEKKHLPMMFQCSFNQGQALEDKYQAVWQTSDSRITINMLLIGEYMWTLANT